MKKIIICFTIAFGIISCKNENQQQESVGSVDVVEIPFTKEGELEFLDKDGNSFQKIDIEIAETMNERSRGLMDRSSMADNQGMIFIFGDDEVRKHTFYMKNTRIPLDIMYFNKDSILINIARNAQPGADSELTPGGTVAAAKEDSKYVVEINGGLAEKLGIVEGETKIRWTRK